MAQVIPVNYVLYTGGGGPQNPWSSGLFNCLEDPIVCIKTCCVPGWQYVSIRDYDAIITDWGAWEPPWPALPTPA